MAVIDPFRIRSLVSNFDEISDSWVRDSAAARLRWRTSLDLAYGSHPDERLDLYYPENVSGLPPIHVFVHGGYWRANRKEDYGFLAETVCAAGAVLGVIGYSLMPKARMAQLVDQVRRAAFWLEDHAHQLNFDGKRMSASGHSAGAHLVTYLFGRAPHEDANLPLPGVSSACLISGVFDLAPISQSFLQEELRLSAEEVHRWSPLTARPIGANVTILVGKDETSPFRQQAALMQAHLGARGMEAQHVVARGCNHMSALAAIVRKGTLPAASLLRQFVRERGAGKP